jgi:hypothetical protein
MPNEIPDADFWSLLDQFLMREKDSVFAILTHIRLAIGAGTILALICCARAFTGPFTAYLELSQNRELRSTDATAMALLGMAAVSSVSVGLIIIYALWRLHRALRQALFETLKQSVEAVEVPLKKAQIEIPEKTANLLSSIRSHALD